MPQNPPPVEWTHQTIIAVFPQLAHVAVDDATANGPHGPVPVRLYQAAEPVAGLVWLHGGGFAFGDLDMPEAHWISLTLASIGVTVCSVDYRLAVHGVRHPVPGDDVVAAWAWALDQLAGQRLPLHLGGASAGGCLAAAVAKRLRDRGHQLPASLVLLYPLAHASLPPASPALEQALKQAPADAMLIDENLMELMATNYAGDGAGLTDPYAFPANGIHRGLPPTLLINAEFDSLRASGERFAADLAADGVEVCMEMEPSTKHGYGDQPLQDGAHRSVRRIASWLGADAAQSPEPANERPAP